MDKNKLSELRKKFNERCLMVIWVPHTNSLYLLQDVFKVSVGWLWINVTLSVYLLLTNLQIG